MVRSRCVGVVPVPHYGPSGRLISITRLPLASTCALCSHPFCLPALAFCDSALVSYPNFSNICELKMDDLNNLLIQLDIQSHEVQGPQDFHQFPELPPEIREKIWKFSFPDARSIRPGCISTRLRIVKSIPHHMINSRTTQRFATMMCIYSINKVF